METVVLKENWPQHAMKPSKIAIPSLPNRAKHDVQKEVIRARINILTRRRPETPITRAHRNTLFNTRSGAKKW